MNQKQIFKNNRRGSGELKKIDHVNNMPFNDMVAQSLNTISVVVIEDNHDIARYLSEILKADPQFRHLATFYTTAEVIEKIIVFEPDLVIADLGLPDAHGTESIEFIKQNLPETKIVVYTVFEDEENIINAIRCGADGYLLKDTNKDLLLLELKVIMMGGATLTPRVAGCMAGIFNTASRNDSPLSERENEVLKMISLGFRYIDIADELDISPHTVRRHIEKIYKKLDVNSKSEAILKGRRQGLLGRFIE